MIQDKFKQIDLISLHILLLIFSLHWKVKGKKEEAKKA